MIHRRSKPRAASTSSLHDPLASTECPEEHDVFQGALKIGQIYKRGRALRPEGQLIRTLNGVPRWLW
jgi:hypothetical protein